MPPRSTFIHNNKIKVFFCFGNCETQHYINAKCIASKLGLLSTCTLLTKWTGCLTRVIHHLPHKIYTQTLNSINTLSLWFHLKVFHTWEHPLGALLMLWCTDFFCSCHTKHLDKFEMFPTITAHLLILTFFQLIIFYRFVKFFSVCT